MHISTDGQLVETIDSRVAALFAAADESTERQLQLLQSWQKGYSGSSIVEKLFEPISGLHVRVLHVQTSDRKRSLLFVTAGFADAETFVTPDGEERTRVNWSFMLVRRFGTSNAGVQSAREWAREVRDTMAESAAAAAYGWDEAADPVALSECDAWVIDEDDDF